MVVKTEHVWELTIMSWKLLVMTKAMPQLVSTQTELAKPRTFTGKISDITNHGMGPQPKAKPTRARTRNIRYLAEGRQEIHVRNMNQNASP